MQQILKSTESGELKAGGKLPAQHQLIKMFGVGRSTILEATSTLSMLGYLQSIQGKGCYVLEDLDSRKATGLELRDLQAAIDLLDLMGGREILKCNAGRVASQRADAEAIDRIKN